MKSREEDDKFTKHFTSSINGVNTDLSLGYLKKTKMAELQSYEV
ncbi:hypothetical protein [Christiangramia salexigens]|nr:hypothetical protein [Christiangramia salexigens]